MSIHGWAGINNNDTDSNERADIALGINVESHGNLGRKAFTEGNKSSTNESGA